MKCVIKERSRIDLPISNDPQNPIKTIKGSEEHTSELQSHSDLVCRLLLEKKKYKYD